MFSIGDSKLKLHLPIFLGLEHAWKCRLGEHIIVYKNTKMLEKNTKATTAIGKHRNQMLFSGSKFRPGDVFLSVQWLLLHWWWMQTWQGAGNGASWNRKSQGKILLENGLIRKNWHQEFGGTEIWNTKLMAQDVFNPTKYNSHMDKHWMIRFHFGCERVLLWRLRVMCISCICRLHNHMAQPPQTVGYTWLYYMSTVMYCF